MRGDDDFHLRMKGGYCLGDFFLRLPGTAENKEGFSVFKFIYKRKGVVSAENLLDPIKAGITRDGGLKEPDAFSQVLGGLILMKNPIDISF